MKTGKTDFLSQGQILISLKSTKWENVHFILKE